MSVFVHAQGKKTVHAGAGVQKMAKLCPRSYWMTPKPEAALTKIKLHTYKKVLFHRRSFVYKIIYVSYFFILKSIYLALSLASVQNIES